MTVTVKIILNLAFCMFSAGAAMGGTEMMTAQDVIRMLDLKPLPEEGGYYRETYRSRDAGVPTKASMAGSNLPKRHASTAIYYLVTPESFSALHRVKSDEIFHFYAGDAVEMIQINESGELQNITIGSDISNGELPQVLVEKGIWQGTRLKAGGRWALMGTTVAPGFEFEDFETGERTKMLKLFPQHREDIIRFTREPHEKAH